ncbi:uncharacterized protein [Polyergus mexicanus]|uniref:uncharacterized protein n=1 Tax=Polyergus mexicanus TaxID=615972 RepID=UPI0038B5371B
MRKEKILHKAQHRRETRGSPTTQSSSSSKCNHQRYIVKIRCNDKEIESSSSQKEDPSMIPEIINIEYKPICEDSDYQDCNYNSDHLSITKKKHDKVADDCQHQSRKNCTTRIIDGQIADSRYDRTKPVMLRIVNWFFGGCPEASRRDQEQIDEVGKEEIFKSTNT